jgi:hypothetical protein
VAALCIALAIAVTGAPIPLPNCGSAGEPEARPLVFDWKRGTYDGVRLGDGRAELRRAVGRPLKQGETQPFEPVGEDFYEIGGLTNFGSPSLGAITTLRYRHRVFAVDGGRVTAWGTTDDRAQTPEGVGVGDDPALVEQRYPSADCFIQNEGTEYATYPLCRVRVCKGRLLGFGGDPIKSVWLAAETKTGLGRCITQA